MAAQVSLVDVIVILAAILAYGQRRRVRRAIDINPALVAMEIYLRRHVSILPCASIPHRG
jgi:hypothetical protein